MPGLAGKVAGARSGKLKSVNGRLVSSRSKSGDPACSQAMSDWKTKGMSSAIAQALAKCRAKAAARRGATVQRAAGNEAKAQVLEHRAVTGKVGLKSRMEQARALRAQRTERQAGKAMSAAPVAASNPTKPAMIAKSRDEGARRQRIVDKVASAQERAAKPGASDADRRTAGRFRGRDLQARSTQSGSGLFTKLHEKRLAKQTEKTEPAATAESRRPLMPKETLAEAVARFPPSSVRAAEHEAGVQRSRAAFDAKRGNLLAGSPSPPPPPSRSPRGTAERIEKARQIRSGRQQTRAPIHHEVETIGNEKGWIAEIKGAHPKYGFERQFVGTKDYSRANKPRTRGVFTVAKLEHGKVYEVNEPKAWGRTERYFGRAENGELKRIPVEEVHKHVARQKPAAPPAATRSVARPAPARDRGTAERIERARILRQARAKGDLPRGKGALGNAMHKAFVARDKALQESLNQAAVSAAYNNRMRSYVDPISQTYTRKGVLELRRSQRHALAKTLGSRPAYSRA